MKTCVHLSTCLLLFPVAYQGLFAQVRPLSGTEFHKLMNLYTEHYHWGRYILWLPKVTSVICTIYEQPAVEGL